jgi:hypothetical protein
MIRTKRKCRTALVRELIRHRLKRKGMPFHIITSLRLIIRAITETAMNRLTTEYPTNHCMTITFHHLTYLVHIHI